MQVIFPTGPRRSPSRRRILLHSLAGAGGALFAPALIGRARAETVIRIGQIEALTGPSAAAGIRGRDGAILAAEDINAAGGLSDAKGGKFRLEVAAEDMANDPKQAVTVFRQFATDSSDNRRDRSDQFGRLRPDRADREPGQTAARRRRIRAPLKEWNGFAYRVNPVAASAVPVVLKKLVPQLHIKRLAVLYDQTQDGQVGDAEVCKKMAGGLGYEVVSVEAFRAGDQDFSPQLATIRSTKPDAIYVAAAPGGVRAVSQIREIGFEQPLLTGYGAFQDPVFWDGTKGQVKGGYTWIGQDLSSPDAQLKSFLDRYNRRFPQQATSFSIYGCDAVYTIAEAVKRAGGIDRQKIAQALSNFEFTTPLGTKISFKNPPEGDNLTPGVVVIQITGRGTYTAV